MAYQNQKETQASGKDENLLPEEQHVREQRSFALPNSLMMALPMTPPPGTPNSVMREMMAEADFPANGNIYGAPNTIRRQPGGGPGFGFFSMGSPSFGRGSRGFDPAIGAHEMSHTVQRDIIPGPVSLSVPDGTIQRNKTLQSDKVPEGMPWDENVPETWIDNPPPENEPAAATVPTSDPAPAPAPIPKQEPKQPEIAAAASAVAGSTTTTTTEPPAKKTSVNAGQKDPLDGLEILNGDKWERPMIKRSPEAIRNSTITTTVNKYKGLVIQYSAKYDLHYVQHRDRTIEVNFFDTWYPTRPVGGSPSDVRAVQPAGGGAPLANDLNMKPGSVRDPKAEKPSSVKENARKKVDEGGAPHPKEEEPAPAPAPVPDSEEEKPAPAPQNPTQLRHHLMDEVDRLLGIIKNERDNIYSVRTTSESSKLDQIKNSLDAVKMKPMAIEMKSAVYGQVLTGLNKIEEFLKTTGPKLGGEKGAKLSLEELQQIQWEIGRKEKELQGLQALKQKKKDEIFGRNGQKSLEDKLRTITSNLPDPGPIFGIDANGKKRSRKWFSLTKVTQDQLDGMVKYYQAWCLLHGRDLGEKGNKAIDDGLASAAAVAPAAAQAPVDPAQVSAATAALAAAQVPVDPAQVSAAAAAPAASAPAPAPTAAANTAVEEPQTRPRANSASAAVDLAPATAPAPVDPTQALAAAVNTAVEEPQIRPRANSASAAADLNPADGSAAIQAAALDRKNKPEQILDENTRSLQRENEIGSSNPPGPPNPAAANASVAQNQANPVRHPALTDGQYKGRAKPLWKFWADIRRWRHYAKDSVSFANTALVQPTTQAPVEDFIEEETKERTKTILKSLTAKAEEKLKPGEKLSDDTKKALEKAANKQARWEADEQARIKYPGEYYSKAGIGTALSAYGTFSSARNFVRGWQETTRTRNMVKLGLTRADTLQKGLDASSAALKTATGAWNTFKNVADIVHTEGVKRNYAVEKHAGKAVKKLSLPYKGKLAKWMASGAGKTITKKVVPGVNIASGALTAISGGTEAVQAGKSLYKLHQAEKQMKKDQMQDREVVEPGKRSDQQKLMDIIHQGRQVGKLHVTTGAFKAVSGTLSAIGGALTLGGVTGAAGAAISGINTGLGLIKSAFEMGYKRHMRKTVVASELNIDWNKEKEEVRAMISAFNPDYEMRDHYVREVILRAHGSKESDWKKAYSEIKKKRAKYLMKIAVSDPPHPYKQTAEQVIEALGVHKVDDGAGNKSFAAGAVKLLEEKLGA